MKPRRQSGTTLDAKVAALVADRRNSLGEGSAGLISPSAYSKYFDHLDNYRFWRGSGRPIRRLWPHQVAAISLAIAYLAADRRLPSEGNVPEAALVKMPTGTGKSGVIAVLARCVPGIERVLVLTPREALTDQLLDDISWRFWQHLGFAAKAGAPFACGSGVGGVALEAADVVRFLPSESAELLARCRSGGRLAAVGTFQALEQVRRAAGQSERELLGALGTFDLAIVDEGHYEPAPTWSRAVRDFNLPTLLLTATPYRNDYKSFRVRGRFVFNYPFGEAVEDKTIRTVQFRTAAQRGPQIGRDTARRFVAMLRATAPTILSAARRYTTHPKIIVRADDFNKLALLQNLLRDAFGERPILIHHQVNGMKVGARQFGAVRLVRKMPDWDKVAIWLHESKLLEGIDDSSIVAVALYDGFDNARQLVQQVGRALRTTDKARRNLQTAWVISAPEHQKALEASWSRYMDFERYASADPQRLVQAEGALPDRLLAMMPEVQYLAGEFRPRFASSATRDASEFRVPASAAIFEIPASFDLAACATEVHEALIAEDRFRPQPIDNMPADSIGFAYYAWRSSPYLNLQFFPEWTLGVCVLVKVDRFLLVNDTGGIVLEPSALGLRRADRRSVASLMPQSTAARPVRVSRMASFSLDVSERAIRSMAIRTRSLTETFTDLLDPVLVPTTTFGFVGRRGRYLGLTRARITDSYGDPLPLSDFCRWARERAAELVTAAVPNGVFARYASVRDRLDAAEATPKSILIDFDDTFAEFPHADGDEAASVLRDVEYDDLCADVDPDGKFWITLGGRKYQCELTFNESTQRYSISSDELDRSVSFKSSDPEITDTPLTTHLNREQAFRVIVAARGVIYAHRKFFEPNTEYVRPDGGVPLLDWVSTVSAFDDVVSEKGETFFNKRAVWARQSVFGVMKSICDATSARDVPGGSPLFGDLRKFDTIVCDDDGLEIGDFLAIDQTHKRVALIHAKVGKSRSGMSVRALQEVGRQALASLAFCSAVAREPKIAPGRWGENVNANGVQLRLRRVFRNTHARTVSEIEILAANALADRSWNREIWIVGGHLIRRQVVEDAITKAKGDPSNRTLQFLMFLESLITGCARGNSPLRIYCN